MRFPLILLFVEIVCAQSLPLAGIAHVGYRVQDLEKTNSYYTGVLGLQRAFQTSDGAVFYKVNDEQYVEFVPGLAASDEVRLTHIALETTDLKAARGLLAARGIQAPAALKDPAGDLSISIRAPEGTRIDLVEYRSGSLAGKARGNARGKFPDSVRISNHLQHTGVIVSRDQLEPVLKFYRDILGCTEFWRYEPTPGDLRLIKLLVPGARRDIIELMIHSGALTRKTIGSMNHINFEVPDIHAAHRFVLAHGAQLPADFRPRVNAEDIWAFNLIDPDGTRIEVQDLTKIPPATIAEEQFHGRRAWVLSNGWMRVSVLAGGGHIAEIRLLSDDPKKNINPLRVPHYPTIEPYTYDDARDNAVYGDGLSRRIGSGYMGHMLCFPIYGPPSPEEARAGLEHHGEAPIVEWRKTKVESDSDGVTLWYGADLPRTQYRVERAIHLPRGLRLVRVEEWVESLVAFDRPMNWMEHATFGPPFVESGKSLLDASATRGLVIEDRSGAGSLKSLSPVAWPKGVGVDGGAADLRAFQTKPHSGTYFALRLDPARSEQFFTLYNPDYRVLVGYVFPSEGAPWLGDWQENRRVTAIPWSGQVVARGLEFGNTPFDEGLRKSVERGSLLDTPSYGMIGARQRLKREFTMVLAEIPEGFRGVKDLRTEHGVPILTSR